MNRRSDGEGLLDSIYFFGSFTFLLARTIGVTILAARINDQSRIALPVLYTCPAKAYCIEVISLKTQEFIRQYPIDIEGEINFSN